MPTAVQIVVGVACVVVIATIALTAAGLGEIGYWVALALFEAKWFLAVLAFLVIRSFWAIRYFKRNAIPQPYTPAGDPLIGFAAFAECIVVLAWMGWYLGMQFVPVVENERDMPPIYFTLAGLGIMIDQLGFAMMFVVLSRRAPSVDTI
jgi:hypothetical protein